MEQFHSPERIYKTNHEEADVIIVHNLVEWRREHASYIMVICYDTNAFVLLIPFYLEKKMTMNVNMESPCIGRTIVDIRQNSTET